MGYYSEVTIIIEEGYEKEFAPLLKNDYLAPTSVTRGRVLNEKMESIDVMVYYFDYIKWYEHTESIKPIIDLAEDLSEHVCIMTVGEDGHIDMSPHSEFALACDLSMQAIPEIEGVFDYSEYTKCEDITKLWESISPKLVSLNLYGAKLDYGKIAHAQGKLILMRFCRITGSLERVVKLSDLVSGDLYQLRLEIEKYIGSVNNK